MFNKLKTMFGPSREAELLLVEEIHHEFDSAQDRLLLEANKIISQGVQEVKPDTTVDDLMSLGFNNAQNVIKHREKVAEQQEKELVLVASRVEADRIMYYKTTYPFLKFLTIQELNRICKKYHLIYAPVEAFIGTVPAKNVGDIKRAQQLKSEDSTRNALMVTYTKDDRKKAFQQVLDSLECSDGIFTEEKIVNLLKGDLADEDTIRLAGWRSGNVAVRLVQILEKYGDRIIGRWPASPSMTWMRVEELNHDELMIAAPKSDFSKDELARLKNTSVVSWEDSKVIIPDPIVFRYVRGGIQVLTKWGPEASDPALLNEIDN